MGLPAVGNLGIEVTRAERALAYLIVRAEPWPDIQEPLLLALYSVRRNLWVLEAELNMRPLRIRFEHGNSKRVVA